MLFVRLCKGTTHPNPGASSSIDKIELWWIMIMWSQIIIILITKCNYDCYDYELNQDYTYSNLFFTGASCQMTGKLTSKIGNWCEPHVMRQEKSQQKLGSWFLIWSPAVVVTLTFLTRISRMWEASFSADFAASSFSEVHFIAFKDHADDPQYLTAATLPVA